MSEEIWKREEPDSPCIRVCLLHPEEKICIGCLRTGAEIAAWSELSREERRALLEALPERASRLRRRRGGRRKSAQRL